MYHRILYAADLNPDSKFVARKAWELASHFDAKLYFVHVVEFIPPNLTAGIIDVETADIQKATQLLAELGKEYLIPPTHQFTLVGSPKVELVNKVKELNIDLIVIGRHVRHGISRLLGSTANQILRDVECDVVTIYVKE